LLLLHRGFVLFKVKYCKGIIHLPFKYSCTCERTWSNRVIPRVRKTQHQNPEFGYTQGEIKKKTAKKYIRIWLGMKLRKQSILVVNWVSSCLSFFLSASAAATYIFTALNSTTTIISLEPCALNAEYQHFILRFIKMSLLCGYHSKRGWGVKGDPKTGWRVGYFTDDSNI
jgi:hypothetical protein